MITANLEITDARDFHANAIERIQASNFNPDVIQKVKNEAVTTVHPEWRLEVENVSVYADRKDMKVTLHYQISPLPMIQDEQERTIVGYAR